MSWRPLRRDAGSGSEVVRIAGQRLAAVLGDEQQILEADAADALETLDARLDRQDVAADERLRGSEPEPRRLVDVQADARDRARTRSRSSRAGRARACAASENPRPRRPLPRPRTAPRR